MCDGISPATLDLNKVIVKNEGTGEEEKILTLISTHIILGYKEPFRHKTEQKTGFRVQIHTS